MESISQNSMGETARALLASDGYSREDRNSQVRERGKHAKTTLASYLPPPLAAEYLSLYSGGTILTVERN